MRMKLPGVIKRLKILQGPGRLDALRIASLFGRPIGDMAVLTDTPTATLQEEPDSSALQPVLRHLNRSPS